LFRKAAVPHVLLAFLVTIVALFAATSASADAAVLSGTVSGKAAGQEAKPLPETVVTVSYTEKEEVVATTAANAEGFYKVEVPEGVFDVRFDPPPGTYEATTVHKVEVTGSRTLNVILTAAEAIHLTGTIHDAGGEPVAGVGFALGGPNGSAFSASAADGSYDLAVVPGTYKLTVTGGNKYDASLPTGWSFELPSVSVEESRSLEFKLPPTVHLTVEAHGSKGEPIAEAFVNLPNLSRPAELGGVSTSLQTTNPKATTNAEGRAIFTLFGGKTSKAGELGILSPPASSGYGATSFEVPAVEEDLTLLVTPTHTIHLTGTIHDAGGEPVAGVGFALGGPNGSAFSASAADGSYDLAVVPGTYKLTVTGGNKYDASLPTGWSFELPSVSVEESRSLEFKLPPTVHLTVEAHGSKGEPIAEAFVNLPNLSRPAELGGVSTSLQTTNPKATTNAEGRAIFTLFGGKTSKAGELGILSPPASSGYGATSFEVPAVEGETTIAIQLGPGEEQEEKEDTEGPRVKEAWIEPQVIDTSESAQRVGFYAHVIDELSGFAEGTIIFRSPGFGQKVFSSEFKLVSGTAQNGFYEVPLTFERFSEAGTWDVSALRLRDQVGNETVLEGSQMEELGLPHTIQVQGEEPDTEAPVMDELTFDRSEVNTGESSQTVNAFAHITDNQAGQANLWLTFRSPSGGQEVVASEYERIAGDAINGSYRIPITFKRFSENGAWELERIRLTDFAGNERVLEGGQIEELGFAHTIWVEGVADTQGPTIDEFTIEPAAIDTSNSPRQVRVTAHVSDDVSGFANGDVIFLAPSREQKAYGYEFKRYEGNQFDGRYEALVSFEQFSETGTWNLSEIALWDVAGNYTVLGLEAAEERGFPHSVTVEAQPPSVTGIAPDHGPESGYTEVELSGSGFGKEPKVWFGSRQAVKAYATSPTTLVAVSPPGSGTVDVTVSTASGTSATSSADRFRYSPPLTLTSNPNPSVHGQKVTFTATLTPELGGGPAPVGSVAFLDGTSVIGVANLTSKGVATLSTTALGAGNHAIVAQYSGDSYYGPSDSSALEQSVQKAETQVTLTSSVNPAPFGANGTVKATVKALAPGAGTPAGTITFRDGETTLATVQMSAGSASFSLKSLGLGSHQINAVYSGDANNLASEAQPLTQTIETAATELELTSSLNPAPYGSSGTLKATVDALSPSVATPEGTVTFRSGAEVLATIPLSSGGVAKYPLKSFTPGSYEITATYSGPEEFGPSEGALTQVVTKAETELALTSTLNPAPYGSSGTLKATVKAIAPGGGTPSGTVTFWEGKTVLATVPLSSSVAKYPLKSMPIGTHEITATYSGDPNYEASGSAITQVVVKAATAVTLTSSKNPAPKGSTGSIKATVKALAPGGGTPTGTVTFSEGETTLAIVPLSSGSASYPLKSLAPGTHVIVARYGGDTNYEASEATITQTIEP
jgi:Big-like domain-containing protein/IPT/TIG domain-containing protein